MFNGMCIKIFPAELSILDLLFFLSRSQIYFLLNMTKFRLYAWYISKYFPQTKHIAHISRR